jgi:uncharacterized Zn finger protein
VTVTVTVTTVVHPRTPARRGAARATRWWAKAWVRAVEEASYSSADLNAARTISRSGRIGQISVEPGRFVAAVEDEHGLWAVLGTVPVLDPNASETLVETVAAESGRVAALLAGDLPHTLVEHAEEAGVELLPYGSELGSTCTSQAWTDPCPHALAVMYQLAWLVEDDPFVLLHLRGLARDDLLARLHERATPADSPEPEDPDVDIAADAALRAAALLVELETDVVTAPDGRVTPPES